MKKTIIIGSICFVALISTIFLLIGCNKKKDLSISFYVDEAIYSTVKTNGKSEVKLPNDPTKTGYEFKGWFYDKDVFEKQFEKDSLTNNPIEENLNVYASFKASEYTATFKNENGTIDTRTFTVEDASVKNLPEVPRKTGYTGKWEVYTLSTSDITIDAIYTPIDYTISFANTKDATNSNQVTYNVETPTIVLTELTKTGYTFDGWFVGEDEVTEITLGSTGNKNLEAKWSLIEYTATFKNGDVVVDTRTFTVEDTVIEDLPIVPEKDYYTNGAWENYEIEANDIEINADYTPIDYTISYTSIEGATNSNEESYNIETLTITLKNPTKAGYTFEGWFVGDDEVTEITLGSTGNKSLEAKWTPIVYTATFKNGTEVVTTRTFTIEDTVIEDIPAVPEKDYYTDGEWEYEIGANNIEINAVYKPMNYEINYINTKEAINNNRKTYNIETQTFSLNDLSKEGYTFDGWFVGEDEVTEIAIGSHGIKNLEAKWSLVNYSITYTNTNEAVNFNQAAYNIETLPIKLKNLIKDGYIFDGWFIGETKVTEIALGSTGDKTIDVKWTLIEYGISYNLDGGLNNSANPATYNVEDGTIKLKNPTQEGKTFNGWEMNSEFVSSFSSSLKMSIELVATWIDEVSFMYTKVSDNNFIITGFENEDIKSTLRVLEICKTYDGYDVVGIAEEAFRDCSALKIVTIPNSVESIGNHAFYNCETLESITIPNNVESIGATAFARCVNLESVTILGSIKCIEKYTFAECRMLERITIPGSVEKIDDYAFLNAPSISEINYLGTMEEWFKIEYGTNDALFYKVSSVDYNFFFMNDSLVTEIEIPNTVSFIMGSIFESCMALTSVTIPSSVVSIGRYAFANCKYLKDVYIESAEVANAIIAADSFGNIVEYATTIYIEESITTIGAYITNNYTTDSTTTIDGVTYNVYTKNAEV